MQTSIDANTFYFKQFKVCQDQCAMKIGTDGVLLGAWAEVAAASRILDIGTGTGLIALMIGQRTQDAYIDALEIDRIACAQAQLNIEASPWADRVTAIHASVQDYAPIAPLQYDLILSNPPFFSGGTFSNNQHRNQVRHTVKLPHGDLLHAVQRLLKPEGGRFCVVLPFLEGLRFKELARNYHLYASRVTEVHSKADKPIERLLMQFECTPKGEHVDELILQESGHNAWTDAYRTLTKDFYMFM